MMKPFLAAGAALALLGLAACDGSSEKTGENLDSAIEETTQGHENLGDGPLERAGENIDNAAGKSNNNDAADAVHDATDSNPSTHP
jgi:predicted outer membrane protein